MVNNSKIKSSTERLIQETLAESLREFGSRTSLDEDAELIKEVMREEEERKSEAIVRAWKPNLNKYPDAVIDVDIAGAVFVPDVGEKIAIEFPNDWQDTAYGTVQSIDEITGIFRIWNERKMYHVMSNFINGREKGLVFKLAPKNIGMLRSQKRKIVNDSSLTVDSDTPKKIGRGRPKGSKNRSKSVIEAEKKELERTKKKKIEKKILREKLRSTRSL